MKREIRILTSSRKARRLLLFVHSGTVSTRKTDTETQFKFGDKMMTNRMPTAAFAALIFAATTSGAFAGSTAAATSHAKVHIAWAEMHDASESRRKMIEALDKPARQSTMAISTTVDVFPEETVHHRSSSTPEIRKQEPWSATMFSIF